MRDALKKIERKDVAAVGVCIGLVAATFRVPGGFDLYLVYRPLAQGCLDCAYVPYYTQWFVFPLAFIPDVLAWPVTMLVSVVIIYWATRWMGGNPLVVLGSFPMLVYVWLGQPDALIIAGLLLALQSKNPYVRGIGIFMASIKPQVTGPAMLLLALRDEEPLKMLIIPAAGVAASFVIYGLDWPLHWINHVMRIPYTGIPAGSLFPFGLAVFPVVLLFKDKQRQLTATLLATSIGIPRFLIYSNVEHLTMFSPWWALPLSYAWLILWPIFGREALRWSFTLPVGLLGWLVWQELKARRAEKTVTPVTAPDQAP